MMKRPVITRYAPSPTGKLHLGGLRTALFNYAFAKRHQGKFILRIEDTDKTREVPGAIQGLCKDLEWAGINYDWGPDKPGPTGPYIQSQRLDIYKKHAETLLQKGHAYRCFCSEHRLEQMRQSSSQKGVATFYDRFCLSLSKDEIHDKLQQKVPHTVRLKIPNGTTEFHDVVRGQVKFQNTLLDDQILLKTDGFPTYHLACVVDDHLMDISHVIRGEEWVNSTPKHVIMYKSFGWETPQFAHLPLLVNPDRSKLSKRQGDASVDYYKVIVWVVISFVDLDWKKSGLQTFVDCKQDKGYEPSALLNFVALLGWSPTGISEIFTLPQLVEHFSLERTHKGASVVNMEKLDWVNEQHIRSKINTELETTVDKLQALLKEKLQGDAEINHKLIDDKKYLANVLITIQNRIIFLKDIAEKAVYFFKDPVVAKDKNPHHAKMWKPASAQLLSELLPKLESLSTWNTEAITAAAEEIATNKNIKVNDLFTGLRYLITGSHAGAGVPHTMETIGKEASLRRVKNGLLVLS